MEGLFRSNHVINFLALLKQFTQFNVWELKRGLFCLEIVGDKKKVFSGVYFLIFLFRLCYIYKFDQFVLVSLIVDKRESFRAH